MIRNPIPTALDTYKITVTSAVGKQLAPILRGLLVQSRYASDVYLFAFEWDGSADPANGSTPLCAGLFVAANSRNVTLELPGGGLKIHNSPVSKGLIVLASSTGASFTKAIAATLDISAMIEHYETMDFSVAAGYSVAGDLTTGVNALTVWADASGPKKLHRVNVKNTANAVRYLTVYASPTLNANLRIVRSVKFGALQEKTVDFGEDGLEPRQQDADLTSHNGCYLKWTTDPTTAGTVTTADANIQAFYK
jgi:hypothetical protein